MGDFFFPVRVGMEIPVAECRGPQVPFVCKLVALASFFMVEVSAMQRPRWTALWASQRVEIETSGVLFQENTISVWSPILFWMGGAAIGSYSAANGRACNSGLLSPV